MNEKRCYTVAEIQEILGCGRQAVVSLIENTKPPAMLGRIV